MSLAPLRAAAAAYVLDAISNEELRQVADEALARGVYTWSVGELGTTIDPNYFVARPLFERALKELGIPLPSPSEAAEKLLSYHFRRMIEGAASTAQTFLKVREVADPYSIASATRRLGLSYSGQYLLDRLFDDYRNYFWHREHEIGPVVQETAEAWIRECPGARVDPLWLVWNDGSIRKMAQAIRDGHLFLDLPLLADALEEAGCSDVETLEHCREQAAHISDCWVVHLLLADG